MAVDEAARHQLYRKLDELLGPDSTSTLMSLLPPVGWADVATKDDLRATEHALRAEIADLRGEFARLRGEFAELRGEVRADIAGLRTEIAEGQRRLTLTLVGSMLSISALTFAANAAF